MNVYVTEREGVNYTMYVPTKVYVQFAHLYSQKTSLKNWGTFDRGGYWYGGQLARGLMSWGACVRGGGGHLSGGNCTGGGRFFLGAIGRIPYYFYFLP